ncbi:MAG: hypothetical protein V9E98_14300 [Candidatus Nanopelagicales bacterium]
MRIALGIAGVLMLGAMSPSVAWAADGDNIPAAANPKMWQKYVASVNKQNAAQDWSTPSGTLIADSGFRPYADGFSFFNTGVPDRANHRVFGSPLRTTDLNAAGMRSLMGKKVCLEGNATGPCTLSTPGKLWRDKTNAGMAGGHCYGFATTVALLYGRELRPEQFQVGAATPYDLRLEESISREIARNMAQQWTDSPNRFLAPPSEVVETLKTALTPGAVPPVFIMYSGIGGHAVTPYALYEGANGRYDVAIYDNNYPDFTRVVRLDTVKETARYAFNVNPSDPDTDDKLSRIGVVPTDFIAAQQPCPFCINATTTTIQIDPVITKVPIKTKVTRLDGKPFPKLKTIKPSNPWQPGTPWTFPTYELPKEKSFILKVNNKESNRALPLSVLATTGAYSLGTGVAKIPAGGVGKVGFDTKNGIVVYRSQNPGPGLLQFADNGERNVVAVSGRARSKSANTIGGGLIPKQKQVILAPVDEEKAEVTADASLEFYKNGKARTKLAHVETTLPAGASLIIDYHKWNRNDPKKLIAYSLLGQDVTRVNVSFS